MPDFTGLADMAKASKTSKGTVWQPLRQEHLGEGMVLFFDQSLTATGWVQVVSVPGLTKVVKAGKVKDLPGALENSIETQLRRGVNVFEEATVLIDRAIGQGYEIAHESPPNPAQVKGGGFGSLMSAQAVRCAAALMQADILMLGAQPGKKLICGKANADKKTAHDALKDTCFPWIEGSDLVTNEATRDALIGALLWLYRRKT